MKNLIKFTACLLLFISPLFVKAQLEKVIVETYYISNANDSADVNGDTNSLPIGSKTYRVYVDLEVGSKLLKLYGGKGHPLKFSSTQNFYNKKDRGACFGSDILSGFLKGNTLALDTWLSLGLAATSASGKTFYGVPKTQDNDGAALLISNSNTILENNDANAGLPLTSADGIFTVAGTPIKQGPLKKGVFFGLNNGNDTSTIFGKIKTGKVFNSDFCSLEDTSGVKGPKADSNQILVAQLTTTGDLSFELNIDVQLPNGTIKRYVASETKPVTNDTIVSAILKYPAACGCKDVNFLEYSNTFSCSLPSACITPIVLGCMDVNACNYNPNANFPVNSLCCYVGYCNDRDIAVVCPSVTNGKILNPGFTLYPNQVKDEVNIAFDATENSIVTYEILNVYGIRILNGRFEINSGTNTRKIDVAELGKGMYLFKLNNDGKLNSKLFVKE
jgi:Secretion system C-terminal sorting domain